MKFNAMRIFEDQRNRGLPADYLLSRIRGRRAYLLRAFDDILYSDNAFESLSSTRYGKFMTEYYEDSAWKGLSAEYMWVYQQMDQGLRNIFYPYFLCFEIKTIIKCLRYRTGKNSKPEIRGILSFSLLSAKIKQLLINTPDLPSLLAGLEKELTACSEGFSGLGNIYSDSGQAGLEQTLSSTALGLTADLALHPAVRGFFVSVIDSRNIIILYKHLRWGIMDKPGFISGGTIKEEALKPAAESGEISDASRIIHRFTGLRTDELKTSNLEAGLQKRTKNILRRSAGTGSEIGIILDYLWRCYLEAKNLSIILYARDMNTEVLKEELVA